MVRLSFQKDLRFLKRVGLRRSRWRFWIMKVTGTDGKEYTIEPRADLSRARLREANLSKTDLSNANLRDANLTGADLTDVCLSEADLRRASLSRAELSGADLSGADLSKVSLTDVYLEGAVWNDNTVFPEGFEIPEKSGT